MCRWRVAIICAAVAAAVMATPAVAEVDVHASLNRETIAMGETVDLTVAISGALLGVEPPRVPSIDYLNVVGTSSRNTVQLTNGHAETTAVFIYELRASREGTYTIPPMDVHVGDDTYTTQAIVLRVVPSGIPSTTPPGLQTPPPGQPSPDAEPTHSAEPTREIDAVTEVDNRNPWVGEQVTLTLKFMQAPNVHLMGNAEYEPPSTEGLVAEPLPDEAQNTEVINGVPYEIVTRQTALIAPAPGQYTIGPATITFRRGFMSDEETIQTDPIALNVRALPARGRPEGFKGAVGSLQLAMSVPTNEVRVGEAASLRLQVTGTGDLRQLDPPDVVVEGDARVYQSGEERQISAQPAPGGSRIGGTVTFDYLIMPGSAGTLTVKPIVVHYFNPGVDRYQSAQTTAATITVLPGEAGQTIPASNGDELRYIDEGKLALRARPPVTAAAWFWVLQALPLLGIGLVLRERAERVHRARDPRYRRRVEAAREARGTLRAISPADHPAEVYRRADEALAEYIAARTDASAAAISPEGAHERLLAAGAGDELAARAEGMLRSLRAGAYAPGAAGAPVPATALDEVRALVDAIEEALR